MKWLRAHLSDYLPGLLGLLLLAGLLWWQEQREPAPWTRDELFLLQALSLSSLPPLPVDPSSAVADDPAAARLGHHLFYDLRLSRSESFSCSSCHRPELYFTDGLQQSRALGKSRRNAPTVVGAAYSPWLYRDGRKDSLWSQALSPLEDPAEQGSNRMRLVRQLQQDALYRDLYAEVFGALPDFSDRSRFPEDAAPSASNPEWDAAWTAMQDDDRVLVDTAFANLGKALAAFQRNLLPAPSRFDTYIDAVLQETAVETTNTLLSQEERRGLRLFIGEAACISCHNGPLFTNNEFHNTGVLPLPGELPDAGRSEGLLTVLNDPFNCVGEFSAAVPGQCQELLYVRTGVELIGAFRTPSLRNIGATAPYMHKGQFATLAEVLEHYNAAPLARIGHNEAKPLQLGTRQLRQLEAFLLTLEAPLAGDPALLRPSVR